MRADFASYATGLYNSNVDQIGDRCKHIKVLLSKGSLTNVRYTSYTRQDIREIYDQVSFC